MPMLEDHAYLKLCAQLASLLSISISSARRRVEIAAVKSGSKDLASRIKIAETLVDKALLQEHENGDKTSAQFDQLLAALSHEENFMIED